MLPDPSDLPTLLDYELLEQVHHKYLLLVCFGDWWVACMFVWRDIIDFLFFMALFTKLQLV